MLKKLKRLKTQDTLQLPNKGTGLNCTKTNLHVGTKLHEDDFAPRVNFARVTFLHESKKNRKIN